jgi:hypothetical protein
LSDSDIDIIENELKKCCGETLPPDSNKWLSIVLVEVNGIKYLAFKCKYK